MHNAWHAEKILIVVEEIETTIVIDPGGFVPNWSAIVLISLN